MSKLATLVVAVGALALAFVTLSPYSSEAGWRRWGWGWSRCERPCRAPLRLVRLSALLPSLCLLLRLSLRLLPLLARTLLARLVLGTRASKAPQQLQRAIPELGSGPSAFLAPRFSAEWQMNNGLSFSSERSS